MTKTGNEKITQRPRIAAWPFFSEPLKTERT